MAIGAKVPDIFGVNLQKIDSATFFLFVQTSHVVLNYSESVLNKAALSIVSLMVGVASACVPRRYSPTF